MIGIKCLRLTLPHVAQPVVMPHQWASPIAMCLEIEIVTNLTNARWLAAYSNYEHEMIAEKDGGLPPEKVQALIAGLPTSFENPRHQVVYEITSALIAPRVVPTGLYRRAVNLLGDTGLTDLTVLIGYFTCISLTLMAYDVPASAIGLER
jgi:4-carboxymuconolactone decarboxylase